MGLSYTSYAVDGVGVPNVLWGQILVFLSRTVYLEGWYDIGCLYIGVNDVCAADWDGARFEVDYLAALTFLRSRCERVLTMNVSLDLGWPCVGAKVGELDAIIDHI